MQSLFLGAQQADYSSEQAVLRRLSSFVRGQPTHQGANDLAKMAEQCDISYLSVLISAGRRYFGEALRQWNKYQGMLEQPLTNFLKYINAKICHSQLPSLEHLFLPLKQLFLKITRKEIPLLQKHKISLQPSDDKAVEYAARVRSMGTRKAEGKTIVCLQPSDGKEKCEDQPIRLEPEKNFGSNVSQTRLLIWKEIYFKIRLGASQELASSKSNASQDYRGGSNPKRGAHLESSNFSDCACCLSYVVEGQDLWFPGSRQPVAYFGRLSRISEMQEKVSEQVVSFLNGKGGVVLVGCRQGEGGEVLVVPQTTWQSAKDSIEYKLQSWMATIYPAVTLKRQVDLSFIPVADQSGAWIKGAYLLRIIVQPTESRTIYFYIFNQLPYFATQGILGPASLKDEDIYRFMNKLYYQQATFSISFGSLRQKGNSLPALVSHLSPCHLPQKGDQDFGTGVITGTMLGEVGEPQSMNPLMLGHELFKNVSLLVVGSSAVPFIQEIFREKQKIECRLETAFPEHKFKLSVSTWLVWHSSKFQKLANGIKKHMNQLKQKNEKKPPLLINTGNYLKILNDPLDESVISELKKVAKEHACEEVEHHFIDDYDFFKCPSAITAVFLYFYSNQHHKVKSVFQKPPVNGKHKHTRPTQKPLEKEQPATQKFRSPPNMQKADKQQFSQQANAHRPTKDRKPERQYQKVEQKQQKQDLSPSECELPRLWQGGPVIWWQFTDGNYNTWYYCEDWHIYCRNSMGQMFTSSMYTQEDLHRAQQYYSQQHSYNYNH